MFVSLSMFYVIAVPRWASWTWRRNGCIPALLWVGNNIRKHANSTDTEEKQRQKGDSCLDNFTTPKPARDACVGLNPKFFVESLLSLEKENPCLPGEAEPATRPPAGDAARLLLPPPARCSRSSAAPTSYWPTPGDPQCSLTSLSATARRKWKSSTEEAILEAKEGGGGGGYRKG